MKKVLARAASAKAGALSVPSLDASVTTLPNGLEVIVREDHAHPLVSVQVWIKAGSMHEEQHTGAGIAHCVEHMLFKGTEKRNPAQISQGIQALGGYVNAYTSFNRTVYWIDGLAEHAGGYLDILADMIRYSKFDADELTREKEVI
ncbi:MAG: pitrilysin family protein, partial [Verrucomicrobia bacterium]|nr:pitrilysin family protein [Verrucomicrobiota bacterium]